MLTLIIGGRAQGKTAYAKKAAGAKDSEIANFCEKNVRVLVHLEETVRRFLAEGREEEILPYLQEWYSEGDKVIVCDEIGLGIVPADPFERRWRDETGRILCALAAKAERVVRIFAGIGQILK